jgi:ubiquinone/menaquinone biosynthesis C-methylase UbiE
MTINRRKLIDSYDRVADEYVAHIYDELNGKPLDRELLTRFVSNVKGKLCDLGCGPGHVTRFLAQQGGDVFGLDISWGMLDNARSITPELEFIQSDMTSLGLADNSLSGIVAFYSIIHIDRGRVVECLRELRRVLKPDALMLIAFHIGGEILHRDELWDKPVSLDFVFFQTEEMVQYLEQAGFVIEEVTEREPYVEVEHPSRRAYILARK